MMWDCYAAEYRNNNQLVFIEDLDWLRFCIGDIINLADGLHIVVNTNSNGRITELESIFQVWKIQEDEE